MVKNTYQEMTFRCFLSAATALAALSVGCASMQNTPAQDYVWDMGDKCKSNTMQITRVEPDGRYWIQGTANVISLDPMAACMKEQSRLHPYAKWLKANKKTP